MDATNNPFSNAMSSTLSSHIRRWSTDTWALLSGVMVLYVPTWVMLARGPWQRDDYTHGPFVLAAFLWLVWKNRTVFIPETLNPSPLAGGIMFGCGLILYATGHVLDIILFEAGSQLPVFAGIALLYAGRPGLKRLLFPILFLVFLIPLPSIVLDILTGPLKLAVSEIAVHFLSVLGYPVSRAGVVITIGQHDLLVADACSGLKSMYTLAAVGVFYVYLQRHGRLHNWVLLASIVPIALVTNIIRVIILALITFHFGEKVGQGLLHNISGMTVFILAVLLMLALSSLLEKMSARFGPRQ